MSDAGEASDPGDGRTRRRERNAEAIYDAADELLATHAYDELSVEDICERAGVGRATFFRIYESKTGLLREFNRRLAADAARRIQPSDDVRTALGHVRSAIVDAWRSAGQGQVGMARELVRAVPSTDLHAPHPELLDLVARQIARAVEAGELDDEVPVEIAASLALVNMVAPVGYAIAGRDVDIDRLSRVLLDQWFAGMVGSSRAP